MKKKSEAIRRMKLLGLHENTIKEFEEESKLNYSEKGILFWVDNEKWKKYIELFEEKYDSLVYHIIHNHTEFGEFLTLLHVSSYEEEWNDDYELLKNNIPYAYVVNLDYDYYSEIGTVKIKPYMGGVLRIA